jgi:hypothetical protein
MGKKMIVTLCIGNGLYFFGAFPACKMKTLKMQAV